MQEHILIGHITGLVIIRVPEFGTRASFRIERAGLCPISCSVAGDVAREFITYYCEGDIIAVKGIYEPRPSTASSKAPWAGRFRVRTLVVETSIELGDWQWNPSLSGCKTDFLPGVNHLTPVYRYLNYSPLGQR